LTIANSTYFYGAFTNGGLVVNRLNTDLTSTKTLVLYGANSYSGGTTVNGSVDYVNNPILQLGNNSALGRGNLTLAGGGSLTVKAVSNADDIYNASRIIGNDISIASGVSGVFDAGSNSVTTLDGSLTSIVTNNMTLTGAMSGGGSLVKTNSGNLTLSGLLTYTGGTTVMDGNLVVVKTNLTATVSASTVGINFSNNVSAGTYAVLPRAMNGTALNGTYPPATYDNLSPGQSAAFDPSTGEVVVSGNPISKTTPTITVTPGSYTYSGSLQGPGINEVNKGDSTGDVTLSYVGTGSTSYAASANPPTNAGTYSVIATVAADLTYSQGSAFADFTIAPKAITVTADAKSKKVGEVEPTLTYTITSGALVGSEQLTGSLNRVTGESVGTYDITQGTLAASSNYNLTYIKASFEVQANGPIFASAFGGASATAVGADGMQNLLRYALGANSTSASVVKPVSSLDANNLSITAIVRINDAKVTVVGEFGTDPTVWNTNRIVGVRAVDQTGATPGETEKQVFSVARGGSRTFLRLKATLAN
jgi:autotransporter-associated beta strand protein